MGRKKSDISEMDIVEKLNSPFPIALNALIKEHNNARELMEHLGISPQAVNQYRNGLSRPSLENICKIADFYNVSVDYLLGRTTTKNPDPNMRQTVEFTGLSEEAIQKILYLQPEGNSVERCVIPEDAIPILNWIICNINNDFLLTYLSNLSKRAKEYQDEKTKIDSETDGGYERFTEYRDAADKLDLEKYRANKLLDRMLDYFIEDYCLNLIDHSKPTWEVISDGND